MMYTGSMPMSVWQTPPSAQAYDRSLVRLRGNAAATNFSLSDYRADLADYYKMQQARLTQESTRAFTGACLQC